MSPTFVYIIYCILNGVILILMFYKLLQMKQLPCSKQYVIICTRMALVNYNNTDQHVNRHDYKFSLIF